MNLAARRSAHRAVSTSLSRLSDRALLEALETAEPLGAGIGGQTVLLRVDGTPVFVKHLPLTELDRRPENVRSTANLFDLPMACHYGGRGGPGFGAWREVAVQAMTTDWVLAGEHEGFPLMYHWRVLPHSAPLPEELADIEAAVAYWGGAPQVRRRLEELERSSASIALFLEYLPQNVFQWLREQIAAGGAAADEACALLDRELESGISFMNSRGVLHFDTHFQNLLTDGERVYFADYGLAISSRFELAKEELEFFERHQAYDRRYTAMSASQWLIAEVFGSGRAEREERLRAYVHGEPVVGMPPAAAAFVQRHAPAALAMTEFFRALMEESSHAPYPPEG